MARLEELQKELQEIQKKQFNLQMIDKWTSEDDELSTKLMLEEQRILKEIENEKGIRKENE